MRQAGVIAAAGIVAIQKMVSRLTEDHANARRLVNGLANIPGITVNPTTMQTNIVVFDVPGKTTADGFAQQMRASGVKVNSRGGQTIRAVTHRMISDADVDEAVKQIGLLIEELS